MMYNVHGYTTPNSNMRLAYTEAEIKAAIKAKFEAVTQYRSTLEGEIKAMLGKLNVDTTVEKLEAIAAEPPLGVTLREDAEDVLDRVRLLRPLRHEMEILELADARATFLTGYGERNSGARVIPLTYQEVQTFIRPFDASEFVSRFPGRHRGRMQRPSPVGLATIAGRGIYPPFEEQEVGLGELVAGTVTDDGA